MLEWGPLGEIIPSQLRVFGAGFLRVMGAIAVISRSPWERNYLFELL